MQVIGYTHDRRAEKPKRAGRQPKVNYSTKSLLLPLGWKGQREKVVLPESRGEYHQGEPGIREGLTAGIGAMGKMRSLPEMPGGRAGGGNTTRAFPFVGSSIFQ